MIHLFHKQLILVGCLLLTQTTRRVSFVGAFSTSRPSFISKQPSNFCLSSKMYHHEQNARGLSSRLFLGGSSFMDRMHGENDDAYFKRILAVAADAKSFENAVIRQPSTVTIQDSSTATSLNSTSSSEISRTKVPNKGGYVRAEDWEAEEKRKAKNASSWEERVQFDGQQHGNRFSQNEILRHHLKGF